MSLLIGVLALQGAVEPHLRHLLALGTLGVRRVTRREDLHGLSGLILPGGESTALLRLLDRQRLFAPLAQACATLPVWGVCAGAILLARELRPTQPSLAVFDVSMQRNAYGPQRDSFGATLLGCPVAFIRAPKVLAHGVNVEVKARHGKDPVWLEQGRLWITTFHPELSVRCPSPFHQRFVERCAKLKS